MRRKAQLRQRQSDGAIVDISPVSDAHNTYMPNGITTVSEAIASLSESVAHRHTRVLEDDSFEQIDFPALFESLDGLVSVAVSLGAVFDENGAITFIVDRSASESAVSSITYNQATREIKIAKADGSAISATLPQATQEFDGLMGSDDKMKLDGIENGAQTNLIERIQRNGVELTVVDKTVNIKVPTQASEVGAATPSDVAIAADNAENAAKAYADIKLTDYLTETEVNELFQEHLTRLLVDQGSVPNRSELPQVASNYDSYMLEDEDVIVFAYNSIGGLRWLPLNFFVDMSLYETVAGASEKMNAAVTSANAYTDTEIAKIHRPSDHSERTWGWFLGMENKETDGK